MTCDAREKDVLEHIEYADEEGWVVVRQTSQDKPKGKGVVMLGVLWV